MSARSQVDFAEVISEDLIRQVNLSRLYPYEISSELHTSGQFRFDDSLGPQIVLDRYLRRAEHARYVYLHEVAHQIAMEYGMHDAPHGVAHNCYFGVLLLTMLKRADSAHYFQIYDIQDGAPSFDSPGKSEVVRSEKELISRFKFVCEVSEEFARGPWMIEEIAALLYRSYVIEEWKAKTRTFYDFCNVKAPKIQRWGVIAFPGLFLALLVMSIGIRIFR
ncbi:hypothetical protein [Herbaspirillum sp. CAH-3]|uniref:hypothetical protein n=1 Tax=Herbaspirillum sp. CAH-3 TaxID=2605746 RepID=UPI0012ACAB62|nr:hypothetical protein [Herbaspirillum sp. CAH-3]MRT30031.1 hypothetical protein [Herbaspirillum sp. CAH-3]